MKLSQFKILSFIIINIMFFGAGMIFIHNKPDILILACRGIIFEMILIKGFSENRK